VKVTIGPDAANPNCLRLFLNGAQLCKVYGWTPAGALFKAQLIQKALEKENDVSLD